MKYISKVAVAVLALTAVLFTSCKKDKDKTTPGETTGTVTINLEHKWGTGNANFTLNTDLIHPTTEDTLNFTNLRYYVSNFKFKKADGTWWVHPESYFLVDLTDAATTKLEITGVPYDEYTDMEYTMGVDSMRNVSGAQTGALAVSNNMFWSWSSGYIMLKAEGTSPNAASGSFAFHLGGFSGPNNIVTVKTASFADHTLLVASGHNSEVHMLVNPAALWETAGSVSGTDAIHMPGAAAKTMAQDFYLNGVTFSHVH